MNRPEDPSMCSDTVKSIQYVMEHYPTKAIFGICLENQLLALASGTTTFKIHHGNRGMNQLALICELDVVILHNRYVLHFMHYFLDHSIVFYWIAFMIIHISFYLFKLF